MFNKPNRIDYEHEYDYHLAMRDYHIKNRNICLTLGIIFAIITVILIAT